MLLFDAATITTITNTLISVSIANLFSLAGVGIWLWSKVKEHDKSITVIETNTKEELQKISKSTSDKMDGLIKMIEIRNDKYDIITKENQELTIEIKLAQEQIRHYDKRFDKLEQLIQQTTQNTQNEFIKFLERHYDLENSRTDKIIDAIKTLK